MNDANNMNQFQGIMMQN